MKSEQEPKRFIIRPDAIELPPTRSIDITSWLKATGGDPDIRTHRPSATVTTAQRFAPFDREGVA